MKYQVSFCVKTWYLHTWKDHLCYGYLINCAFSQQKAIKVKWFGISLDTGYWYFARSRSREIQVNPQNPVKFTKTRKKTQNVVEILSNTCLYNIFETYFSCRGYLLAINLQIYLGTSSLKRANNVPKLPGIDYVAKNWALAIMLKALPLVHFWSILLLKEQVMTSVRKMLKTLVWPAQNQSISSKICLENNHKIGRFCRFLFGEVFPENSSEIPAKSADFSMNLSIKIPQNLTFSSTTYQKPCLYNK